jgi:hypothetical protein
LDLHQTSAEMRTDFGWPISKGRKPPFHPANLVSTRKGEDSEQVACLLSCGKPGAADAVLGSPSKVDARRQEGTECNMSVYFYERHNTATQRQEPPITIGTPRVAGHERSQNDNQPPRLGLMQREARSRSSKRRPVTPRSLRTLGRGSTDHPCHHRFGSRVGTD